MIDATPSKGVLLVLNAGSSSIKFAIYDVVDDKPVHHLHGEIEGIGTHPRIHAEEADGTSITDLPTIEAGSPVHRLMETLIHWIEHRFKKGGIIATGHRVVLGGFDHSEPALIDDALLARLRELIPLAPMHQPRNLEPIEALAKLSPNMPQVACFDTAFHRTMPELAQIYGIPRALTKEGTLRFGFHGLSYEYIASLLPSLDERAASGRTVIAHLGNGASMCALRNGRSVATTMGFSPLSGLVMGTRPGELDPGLVLWLLQAKGMSVKDVEHMLYHDCGLKGVSGLSSDMRDLLESDDPNAKQAVGLFVYRICRELGSLASASEGLDALIFTAGIGENAAPVREAVCKQSAWLGIELDQAANAANAKRISTPTSRVSVWVVPTDEEGTIARHTLELVRQPA